MNVNIHQANIVVNGQHSTFVFIRHKISTVNQAKIACVLSYTELDAKDEIHSELCSVSAGHCT